MKTAISIPDEVFEQADRLARKLKKTRSQLYTEAVTHYLVQHDPETITDRMNSVIDSLSDQSPDFVRQAGRRILRKVEW